MENKMLGLRTAIYQVGDITAAKKWYTEAFGTAPYFDEPFYVGFDIGGFELGLQPESTAHPTKSKSVVAYWGVEAMESTYTRLIDMGATAFSESKEVGGGILVAELKDPWDNIIGLIFNPHFKG